MYATFVINIRTYIMWANIVNYSSALGCVNKKVF